MIIEGMHGTFTVATVKALKGENQAFMNYKNYLFHSF
jgi:hypothetical protein